MVNDDNLQRLEAASKAWLSSLRDSGTGVSPYLETRVVATVRARLRERRERRRLFFWKSLATASMVVALVLGGKDLLLHGRSGGDVFVYEAPIQKAMLVKVEIQPLETSRIVTAEVDLPEGVGFYSKSHPELAEQRRLVLNWDAHDRQASRFPFAILSTVAGTKTVHVRFRDADQNLVEERSYQIRFTANGPGSAT